MLKVYRLNNLAKRAPLVGACSFALKSMHVMSTISRTMTPTALLYPFAAFSGLIGTPRLSTHLITKVSSDNRFGFLGLRGLLSSAGWSCTASEPIPVGSCSLSVSSADREFPSDSPVSDEPLLSSGLTLFVPSACSETACVCEQVPSSLQRN